MNIKEAKQQIKNAVLLYLKKNDKGEYVIPLKRQRPIFLQGAPGLGKTAIMEQIARELGIGLVSYSMTHHTRQSALGLPVLEKKMYGEQEFEISRYTMSEIIASVYDAMENSGIKEGILFLDEINCVSETLSPAMLLFLQYKIFGSYQVPEGWVIVTAGNPPEYNRQVREFDVVTLDRLRILHVEADYESFREYATEVGLHPAVLSYLDLKKENFYLVETGMAGKRYVTARGWEDLSEILLLSEQENIPVVEELVSQYLRKEEIATDFFAYYELFCKYRRNYNLPLILSGKADEMTKQQAKDGAFDERLILLTLLLDAMRQEVRIALEKSEACRRGAEELKFGLLNDEQQMQKEDLKKEILLCQKFVETVSEKLNHLFGFVEEVFGTEEEMLLLLNEMSTDVHLSAFVAQFGVSAYSEKSDMMLLKDKGEVLKQKCNRILNTQ